jgi:hypothetical protein
MGGVVCVDYKTTVQEVDSGMATKTLCAVGYSIERAARAAKEETVVVGVGVVVVGVVVVVVGVVVVVVVAVVAVVGVVPAQEPARSRESPWRTAP